MIKTIAGVLLLACSLGSSLGKTQTIYQSTDKNGNPVFTDQPQSTAKPVELKSINTTPSITPITGNQPEPAAVKGYDKIALSVPSSIPNGLSPTTVNIVIEPQLRPGDAWQLLLDGSEIAQGQESSVTLEQMERGEHQFLLQVTDQQGNVVGSSPATDVFVYWPNKNR